MNKYFPNLFSPMKVKKTTFKNRIFGSPTGMKELTDLNHNNVKNVDFLKRRAREGLLWCVWGMWWYMRRDAWTGATR